MDELNSQPTQTENTQPQQLTKKQRRELRRQEKLAHREDMQKQTQKQSLLKWGMLLVVLVAVVWGMFQLASEPRNPDGEKKKIISGEIDLSNEWVRGTQSAPLTLIEYSDLQCPFCAQIDPVLRKLINDQGESVKLVYRHYPLNSHRHSQLAAQATEAAGIQGKFWEMHDILFETQSDWSQSNDPDDLFVEYADEIGLNVGKFQVDLKSSEVKASVKADKDSGDDVIIEGTPTFFLNGEFLSTPKNYDEWVKIIEKAMSEVSVDEAQTTQETTVEVPKE